MQVLQNQIISLIGEGIEVEVQDGCNCQADIHFKVDKSDCDCSKVLELERQLEEVNNQLANHEKMILYLFETLDIPFDPDNPPWNQVTVTFEANGGTSVASLSIPAGSKLEEYPMPYKEGYIFLDWYQDELLTHKFYFDQTIENDIILYADYIEQTHALEEEMDPNKYIENCPSDFVIMINSDIDLNEQNILQYVRLESFAAEPFPDFNISSDNDTYFLTPVDPYIAGAAYKISLLDDRLTFENEFPDIRVLSFRIAKDNVENVVFNPEIKEILLNDVMQLGKNVYQVPSSSYNINVNDIIKLWDGSNEGAVYLKVTTIANLIDNGEEMLLLHTNDCSIDEIFAEFEFYNADWWDGPDALMEQLQGLSLDQLAEEIQSSEGALKLMEAINIVIDSDEKIQSLILAADEESTQDSDINPSTRNESLALSAQASCQYYSFTTPKEGEAIATLEFKKAFGIDDLTVSCILSSSNNVNLNMYGGNWPMVIITFAFDSTIKNNLQVKANVTIKVHLTQSLQGGCDSTWFDYAVNNYIQSDFLMEIIAKSKDDQYEIDAKAKIQELIANGDTSDDESPASLLKKVLSDKGDFIDIVQVKLFEYKYVVTIPVAFIPIPVCQINFELEFVVRVNFALGLSSKMSYCFCKQIGVTGDFFTGKLKTYEHNLVRNGIYQFDLYAAGHLYFKIGLRGSLSVSLPFLEMLGKAGVRLELGGYADLYGFIYLRISCLNSCNRATDISLQGAIYFETGIYVELALFAETEIFKASVTYGLVDFKLPLFSLGERYVFSKFINPPKTTYFVTDYLPISGENGLLVAEYIDIKSGKIVNFDAPFERFTFMVGSLFYLDGNNVHIDEASVRNLKSATTDLVTSYKGGTLSFNLKTQSFNVNDIKDFNNLIVLAQDYFKYHPNNSNEDLKTFLTNNIRVYQATSLAYTLEELDEFIAQGGLELTTTTKLISTSKGNIGKLIWMNPSMVGSSDMENLVDVCLATYILKTGAEEVKIGQKAVAKGQIPGEPRISASGAPFLHLLQGMYGVMITSVPDYDKAISEDTSFIFEAIRLQRLVCYSFLSLGSWVIEVYAVDHGVQMAFLPESSERIDENIDFFDLYTEWTPDSRPRTQSYLPVIWCREHAIDLSTDNLFVSGIDTTQPYIKLKGEMQDLTRWNLQQIPLIRTELTAAGYGEIFESISYGLIANYRVINTTVTLNYPSINTCKFEDQQSTKEIDFPAGNRLSLSNLFEPHFHSFDYIGLDESGDGEIDYSIDDLPLITNESEFTVIRTIKKFNASILDEEDTEIGNETIDWSCQPEVLDTVPIAANVASMSVDITSTAVENNSFIHWKVHIPEYSSTQIHYPNESKTPIFSNCIISPVFDKKYTLTFTYPNLDGQPETLTKQFRAGLQPMPPIPVLKTSDNANEYSFTGWLSADEKFFISSANLRFDVSADLDFNAVIHATVKKYTVSLNLSSGITFSDGATKRSFISTWENYEVEAQVFMSENTDIVPYITDSDETHFTSWSTSPNISINGKTIDYSHGISVKPRYFTLTRFANGGYFTDKTLSNVTYNETMTEASTSHRYNSDVVMLLPIDKATDEIGIYALTGWKDERDVIYGLTDEINIRKDTSVWAIFEIFKYKEYVFTFDGNGGLIDNQPQVQLIGRYNEDVVVNFADPIKAPTTKVDYHFADWDKEIPQVFNESITFTAQYTTTPRFNVTLNANIGKFADGTNTFIGNYSDGSTLPEMPIPIGPNDIMYDYEFIGWDPELISIVTQDSTHDAVWKKTQKIDFTMPTEIYIFDGSVEEDIYLYTENANQVDGYTYKMVENARGQSVPTLTVYNDELRVSGAPNGGPVHIVIASTVSNITFTELYLDSELFTSVVEADTNNSLLNITLESSCRFQRFNDSNISYISEAVFNFNRPVTINGNGHGLIVNTQAYYMNAFICADITFEKVFFSGFYISRYGDRLIIGNTTDQEVTFTDSYFNITSSTPLKANKWKIIGNNTISYLQPGALDEPRIIFNDTLIFEDFIGTFKITNKISTVLTPVVLMKNKPLFINSAIEVSPSTYGVYYKQIDYNGQQFYVFTDSDANILYDEVLINSSS